MFLTNCALSVTLLPTNHQALRGSVQLTHQRLAGRVHGGAGPATRGAGARVHPHLGHVDRCEAYITHSDTRQKSPGRRTPGSRPPSMPRTTSPRDLALQNIAILEKRLAIVEDLAKFITRARGQLSLIQNTVALLRDQVMTMTTPQALTAQLDELLMNIDAMRETTREINAVVTGASIRPTGDSSLAPNPEVSVGSDVKRPNASETEPLSGVHVPAARPVKKELPTILSDQAAWEQWLEQHHSSSTGVWMKIAKKGTGESSASYAEALDVALCFGSINGQKNGLDETFFLQKFTPAVHAASGRRSTATRWPRSSRRSA